MKSARKISLFILIAILAASALRAQSVDLRIAAAADLKPVMGELVSQYEKQSSTKIALTYSSSGALFTQIQNGAPFDIFFSADMDYPCKLRDANLIEPGSLSEYAIGSIVLWMPASAGVNLQEQHWNALQNPSVRKIAVANPSHAPYGRAAVAALKKASVYDAVQAKLVYGENISQAAQFAQSGNAQAAIVSLSLALTPAMSGGVRWEIPQDLYPPLEQGVVMLKTSTNKSAARSFLQFVKGDPACAILKNYGFSFPPR